MDKYADDVAAVAKGHKCIAEALNELEVVKEAFMRSSRIEKKIIDHDTEISEIRSKMQLLSTYSYVNSKNNEFYNCVESIVKSKLDEYTFQIMFELSKKVDEKDFKKQLELKVSNPDFYGLKNSLANAKLKLDTFMDVEYPAHKAKMQTSLVDLAGGSEKMLELASNMEKLTESNENFTKQIKEINEKLAKPKKSEKKKLEKKQNKIIEITNQVEGGQLLYEKIDDIEKNVKNIFNENLSSKTKFLYVEEVIKSILKQLERLGNEQARLEKVIKDQELKCIERMRLKDMQNQMKNDRIIFEKLPGDEIKKLHKEINEKNKRIVIIENNLKQFITEVEFVKNIQKDLKEKVGEIEKFKNIQGVEINSLKHEIEELESTLNESVKKSGEVRKLGETSEFSEFKGKRSWDAIKGLSVQDFYKPTSPAFGGRKLSKGIERSVNFSPRVFKYK